MDGPRTVGSSRRGLGGFGLRLLALLAALTLIAAACGDDGDGAAGDGTDTTAAEDGDGDQAAGGMTLEQAQQDGVVLGFADEVPYGFEDPETGEPSGEAPTVARAVLDELGVEVTGSQVVDFGALINGLNAGRFDIIAAGMFITEERASQALFTDPDYCATTAFAVPEGNPMNLTNFESVAESDATLGVLSGAVEDGYAVDSGVPDGQISRFDTTAGMVDALTSGRIDAFALTAITVREQMEGLEGFEASEGFVPVIDGEEQLGCGGYVFRFEDIEFRDAFNEVLVEMRQNDEILPLVREFGFTAAEIDAAKGVTVEDLIGMPYDFAMNQ